MKQPSASLLIAILLATSAAPAQQVDVREHVLDNGLRLLLVPRKGDPNVAAGWVARVGSVNERPGITGIAHLFEHMMFKGTRTLGTSDIEKDLEIIGQLDATKIEMAREEEDLARRLRVGEIEDARDPAVRSARHQELRKKFEELLKSQKKVLVKDEFDKVYSSAGGSGMNAGTTYDLTIYFINVPANKLELWYWMESDRLLNPVFREFYSERDVVREERRLRTESTPTGRYEEQFEAMFWGSSPYSWPIIGWPSDVEAITRAEAAQFYDTYYAPNNLTCCLVGDFEIDRAIALAERYFGRLKRGAREPAPVRTVEVPQLAEKRMVASAETKPRVTIRYHSVADGHVDEPALVLLSDILNGRTGRLYKDLVLERKVATSASASQQGRKYEGFYQFSAVAADGHEPEEVEKILLELIDGLAEKEVSERELQKVKNQNAASEFRKLRSNFSLLLQLLFRDANRGWRTINTDPALLQAVTAADIQRVAKKYFRPENRSVLIFHTKEDPAAAAADAADPILAKLSPEDRAQVKQLRAFVAQADRGKLEQALAQFQAMSAQVPEDKKPLFEAMIATVKDALEKGGEK